MRTHAIFPQGDQDRQSGQWSLPPMTDPAYRFSWAAGLAFAGLCLAFNFPGRMNVDTLFAFVAGTTPGLANNWHSATLGWIWSMAMPWLGQPTSGLLVQALLFGLFAGVLPPRPRGARAQAAFAGELVLRLILAASLGYVGKDAMMALCLMIATQWLRRVTTRRLGVVDAMLVVAVAFLFLLSKAPNFLVLVVAAAIVLPFLLQSPKLYGVLVVAALLIGMLAIPLNRTVDRVLFHARDLHPDKQIVLFDLAGISVRSGKNAFAGVPGWPSARLPPPESCYVPYMWDSFAAWAPCGGYARAYDGLDAVMTRHWLSAIATHPIAYLRHRLDYVGYLMESQDHATWGIDGDAVNDATDPAARAVMARNLDAMHATMTIASWAPSPMTPAPRWLERHVFKFAKAQAFALLACLAVLLANWIQRQNGIRLGAVLAAALGTGNVAMLAVFGVADPTRYVLPTIVLAYLALLAMLWPARPAPPRDAPQPEHDRAAMTHGAPRADCGQAVPLSAAHGIVAASVLAS